MKTIETRKGVRVARAAALGAGLMLLVSAAPAPAQTAAAPVAGQALSYAPMGVLTPANSQLPQDIRIMQRIVTTALGEVAPPEMPALLRDAAGTGGGAVAYVPAPDAPGGSGGSVIWARPPGNAPRLVHISGRDVSGFYMQGYGYLFTVNWRVTGTFGIEGRGYQLRAAELAQLATDAGRAAEGGQSAESRAAEEARTRLEAERHELEVRQAAWEDWARSYRSLLADELAGVIAQYGSTLARAQADESITFIADFGGDESDTVTATVRRGELSGVGREENIGSVRLAVGGAATSDGLRTELKILSAILDTSLQGADRDEFTLAYGGRAWGSGGSGYQYVPGYGVLLRRSSRLNLATRVIRAVTADRVDSDDTPSTLRQRIDESTEDQRETYARHLADLKQRTAEVLATYGPTLTHLGGSEWVGVYYDVGSAAGLLEGGISDFLVQARMADIRDAAASADPAGTLIQRLVTNERQE